MYFGQTQTHGEGPRWGRGTWGRQGGILERCAKMETANNKSKKQKKILMRQPAEITKAKIEQKNGQENKCHKENATKNPRKVKKKGKSKRK